MRAAFGWKAHSGWAALVVLGAQAGRFQVVDRRRVELVTEDEAGWVKAPFHAAEGLDPRAAAELVRRSTLAARRNAQREMRAAVKRAVKDGHDVVVCAVLMGSPMPPWSVEEIRAVHFRMHKAEGVLWREALTHAADGCGLRLVAVPEKPLAVFAGKALAVPRGVLPGRIAALGKGIGPPWGKDQKDAALAAMAALAAR